VAKQTHQICKIARAVLDAAGSSLDRVDKVAVSCPDLGLDKSHFGREKIESWTGVD